MWNVTRKETMLYDFFDWPHWAVSNARLINIGIANAVNLPVWLSPIMLSLIGQKQLFFAPTIIKKLWLSSRKALASLVMYDIYIIWLNIFSFLSSCCGDLLIACHFLMPTQDVFETEAIEFAARKTAKRTWDIRKASIWSQPWKIKQKEKLGPPFTWMMSFTPVAKMFNPVRRMTLMWKLDIENIILLSILSMLFEANISGSQVFDKLSSMPFSCITWSIEECGSRK